MTSEAGTKLSTLVQASQCPFLQDKSPSIGSLEPLKTAAEVRADDKTIDAYICRIHAQSAAKLFKVIRTIPNQQTQSLQHLKRFAKSPFLPEPLQCRPSGTVRDQTSFYALLAPATAISEESLCRLLTEHELLKDGEALSIFTLPVPQHPPVCSAQAQAYSIKYWPTSYTNANPFGPHSALIAQTKKDLKGSAGQWMALARRIGREAREDGRGFNIGTVIVEKHNDGTETAVVVAGDTRHINMHRPRKQHGDGDCLNTAPVQAMSRMDSFMMEEHHSNPASHAVMRAVDLVAQKRRMIASLSGENSRETSSSEAATSSTFLGQSSASDLTSIEAHFLNNECEHTSHSMMPNGYLCLDLMVYTTHEPCICCAMALVHSRIGSCVFETELPDTGGFGVYESRILQIGDTNDHITNDRYKEEVVLGRDEQDASRSEATMTSNLSLFWRQDLNWRFTAWKWRWIWNTEEGESRLNEDTGSVTNRSLAFPRLPRGTHA